MSTLQRQTHPIDYVKWAKDLEETGMKPCKVDETMMIYWTGGRMQGREGNEMPVRGLIPRRSRKATP